jgi:aspartyl-tRNA(Asn)/glutamyl-tRNA(Gln) amidotransferase subunit C
MNLTDDQVLGIAELARLAVPREALTDLARELSAILDFVEQMNTVDTSGVEPMAHPQDVPQRLRPDEVTERIERDRYQAVAPAVENGLYLVPRVIE